LVLLDVAQQRGHQLAGLLLVVAEDLPNRLEIHLEVGAELFVDDRKQPGID
jgi:hypothetical protein